MEGIYTPEQLLEERQALITQAKALVSNKDSSAEDVGKAKKMLADAEEMLERSKTLAALNKMQAESGTKAAPGFDPAANRQTNKFKSWGEYLVALWRKAKFNEWDERIKSAYVELKDDPYPGFAFDAAGWIEAKAKKDLVENVGALGGFTVFPEYRAQLFQLSCFQQYVRERALVIPMNSRQVVVPVLDQTGTTAGQSNVYGGVVPSWTEEATEKDETEPNFRQMALTAHKLVVYTEASDELLADSAIGLEALLSRLMSEAINNEADFTFIQGTGAGQPLGIVDAGAGVTIRVARQAANQIQVDDIFNMLSQFCGDSPIWLAHQSTMPQILRLNGPAANPSYVWVQNVRDEPPMTLMGYPIFFIENCPTLGSEGDIILADWSKYVIGERQTVTLDSSKHYRFRDDITAWRAVARFDGRPWLSAPLTMRDGTTQVSPFVILDDAVVS